MIMQKGSSPNGHFHPNSFDLLRLGSYVDDATTYQTNVMFTDPCSLCGNNKRKILTPKESRKRIAIDPNSINNSSPTPTTTTPSFSPPLISVPANTNNVVNAQFVTTTPESKNNTYNNNNNNNNNNLGSLGRSSSPATVPLPPRHPVFRRSVSDPIPSSKSLKESFFFTKFLGKPAKEKKRWQNLRERLTDMKDWVDTLVEDEDQEDEERKDGNTLDIDTSQAIGRKEVADVMEGDNGHALVSNHQCCSGKKYQFCLSVRSI